MKLVKQLRSHQTYILPVFKGLFDWWANLDIWKSDISRSLEYLLFQLRIEVELCAEMYSKCLIWTNYHSLGQM